MMRQKDTYSDQIETRLLYLVGIRTLGRIEQQSVTLLYPT